MSESISFDETVRLSPVKAVNVKSRIRKKEVVFMDSVLRMRKISWRFKYSEIQFADNSGGMAAS